MAGKRSGNKPWRHVYGVDRAYTIRVDHAKARGEYTPTKAELAAGMARPPKHQKVVRNLRAEVAAFDERIQGVVDEFDPTGSLRWARR